jgi:hypothetical protein
MFCCIGRSSGGALAGAVICGLLMAALTQVTGCTTTRTASRNVGNEIQKLELKTGDEIKLITSRRERFKMLITEIKPEGLTGKTMSWEASEVAPNQDVYVAYSDLAFIQLDRPSPAKTVGLVASVTLVGALVAAIAVAPVPLVVP